MEPLFKTNMQYTFEEYKKFNKALVKKVYTAFAIIFFEIVFLTLSFTLQNVFLLLIAVLYPIILFSLQNKNIKKIYESNKLMQDVVLEYEFYDDYFYAKYKAGEAKVEYVMLDKIIETNTNFYLMIAKNQGYLLLKANFPEGLTNFIHKLNIKK